MQPQTTASGRNLLRPNRFAQEYKDVVTIGGLRWQIHHSKENGLDACGAIIRIRIRRLNAESVLQMKGHDLAEAGVDWWLDPHKYGMDLETFLAETAAAPSGGNTTSNGSGGLPSSGGSGNNTGGARGNGVDGGGVPSNQGPGAVHLHLDLSNTIFLNSSTGTPAEFAEMMARIVQPQLAAMSKRSR